MARRHILQCSFHGGTAIRGLLCFALLGLAATQDAPFTFYGFRDAGLTLDGSAAVTPGGLLTLTNTSRQADHAFFPRPLRFKPSPNAAAAASFSSNFVFAVLPELPDVTGHGLAFFISPSPHLTGSTAPPIFMGLLNRSTNGKPGNRLVAVELDTIQNLEFADIDDNHVGININNMTSCSAATAAYHTAAAGAAGGIAGLVNLSLDSGDPMQVWVEYDGSKKQVNVTISPMDVPKPATPLLSASVDLSNITLETMYVGFSAASGKFHTSHVILGWSFAMDGKVQPFNLSTLPSLPRKRSSGKRSTLLICLSLAVPAAVLAAAAGATYMEWRRRKFSEVLEDWEQDYAGPHRFSYRDLYRATKGFKEKGLLGAGGFGKVYRGVLPGSKTQVAIKKVSHDSRQGMREFVAEIVSIGRLRHRSLVQLLGYCRRKGELLLVYDYMPHGSLDRFLFDPASPCLDWSVRYRIIRDVAAGMLYLHEEWEQVVLHRDIKASNVLLDGEFGAKLGDFGLARLYDHKAGPQTTHIVGTMGYIAPELTRTSKATTATDVFAFGAFLLEVASGKRPIGTDPEAEGSILVDWVLEKWRGGEILGCVDPRLGKKYAAEEAELVLLLGLRCSHPSPAARPGTRLVVQVLDGDAPLPEVAAEDLVASFQHWQGFESFDDLVSSYPSSIVTATTAPTSSSLLSGGR